MDSHYNGTYEEAFRSLATDISSTIQHQLDIYGWVSVCVLIIYAIRIYKYVL